MGLDSTSIQNSENFVRKHCERSGVPGEHYSAAIDLEPKMPLFKGQTAQINPGFLSTLPPSERVRVPTSPKGVVSE